MSSSNNDGMKASIKDGQTMTIPVMIATSMLYKGEFMITHLEIWSWNYEVP